MIGNDMRIMKAGKSLFLGTFKYSPMRRQQGWIVRYYLYTLCRLCFKLFNLFQMVAHMEWTDNECFFLSSAIGRERRKKVKRMKLMSSLSMDFCLPREASFRLRSSGVYVFCRWRKIGSVRRVHVSPAKVIFGMHTQWFIVEDRSLKRWGNYAALMSYWCKSPEAKDM